MATAIAVLPVACKDETRKDADKAAENVQDQREDVREDVKDLNSAVKDHDRDDVADEAKELKENVGELQTAEADFAVRRTARADQLRVLHSVIASQPMLINSLGGATALTDKARAELAEKMQVFQMRIDEAGNAIEAIQAADAAAFEERNDAAAKAMDRLEDARDDAWEALNDGDRIEAS